MSRKHETIEDNFIKFSTNVQENEEVCCAQTCILMKLIISNSAKNELDSEKISLTNS